MKRKCQKTKMTDPVITDKEESSDEEDRHAEVAANLSQRMGTYPGLHFHQRIVSFQLKLPSEHMPGRQHNIVPEIVLDCS